MNGEAFAKLMDIIPEFNWGALLISTLISYPILSFLICVRIGIMEYFRIKKSNRTRNVFSKIGIKLVLWFLFGRIIRIVVSLVFYKAKTWAKVIVYNHMLNYNLEKDSLHRININNVRYFKLLSNKYKHGFYICNRVVENKDMTLSELKLNKITIKKVETKYMSILFPIAFAIWLYQDDKNSFSIATKDKDINAYIYLGKAL